MSDRQGTVGIMPKFMPPCEDSLEFLHDMGLLHKLDCLHRLLLDGLDGDNLKDGNGSGDKPCAKKQTSWATLYCQGGPAC